MRRSLLALAALLLALALAPAARADEVTSFDGTRIVYNWFPAANLPAGAKAPTVLIGPGYSSGGEDDGNGGSVAPFRKAGYNVLTWDPRGFGQSGGTVQVDSPDFEARDVQALLDAVARRPAAQLDSPGDPRVGMSGGSYGGGIQFVTAAIDPRVDAIAPSIAWHSLITSLFKEDDLKSGWGSILCSGGESRGLAEGILQPKPETGAQDEHIFRTCTVGLANGRAADEDKKWFAARGPGALISRIRVPTLIMQGTVDTLFTLRESAENHALLRETRVPLKMMWFCGGHGACRTGAGPAGFVDGRVLAWMDRWVKRDARVDTGPAFEWLADDAKWRAADGFQLPRSGALRGSGAGTLPIAPGEASGAAIAATPAPPGTALEVPVQGVKPELDVLGEPRLKLTYRGTAQPGVTRVYAQIVDNARRLVVGNQATPIPLTLDGQERTVERPLEPIAVRTAAGSSYTLQLVSSSSLYAPQRSTGSLSVVKAEVELPVVDAAKAVVSPGERKGATLPGATGVSGPPAAAPRGCTSRRTISIRLRGVPKRARLRSVTVRVSGKRTRRLSGRRRVRVDLRGAPAGRVTVRIVARTKGGRRYVDRRSYRTCAPGRRG